MSAAETWRAERRLLTRPYWVNVYARGEVGVPHASREAALEAGRSNPTRRPLYRITVWVMPW